MLCAVKLPLGLIRAYTNSGTHGLHALESSHTIRVGSACTNGIRSTPRPPFFRVQRRQPPFILLQCTNCPLAWGVHVHVHGPGCGRRVSGAVLLSIDPCLLPRGRDHRICPCVCILLGACDHGIKPDHGHAIVVRSAYPCRPKHVSSEKGVVGLVL